MNAAHVHTTATQRWFFLGVISVGLFLIGMDGSVLFTALPVLEEQLHTTETQGLWIINAYPLAMCGLLMGTGTLGDRIGHRRMFVWGLVIFGLASISAAYAPTTWLLIAARGLLGAAAAIMMPATLALIRITFEEERERNTAIGVWGSVFVIGAVTGPIIGGVLLEYLWWGSVFAINVPIVLVTVLVTLLTAPPNITNPDKHWDALASLYALLTLGGLVVTIEQLISPHRNILLLIGGIASLVIGAGLFRRRQASLAEPLVDFGLFGNPIFLGGFLAAGISTMITSGTQLMTSQRFQLVESFTPLEAGMLSAAMAASAFPSSILAGAYLDRMGFRPLMVGSFLLATLGLATATVAMYTSHFSLFVGGLLLTGLGAGAIMSCASVAMISSAPPERAGMASSLEEVSFEFGALIAVATLGSILSLVYSLNAPAGVPISHPLVDAAKPAYDTAYQAILVVVVLLSLLGTGLSARLFAPRKEASNAH